MFITEAFAQSGAAGDPMGGVFMQMLPLILILVVFYFLLIRPQQKRHKEHQSMLSKLATGDEVVTGGGLLGRVTEVGDIFVSVEIADGVRIKVQRQQITQLVPKGTFKSA
jgi:preprotein translocase subunit YajC